MNHPTHGNLTANTLRAYIKRIQKLQEEKDCIAEDIKAVFSDAAGRGFDKKALKAVIKIMEDTEEAQEHFAMVELYLSSAAGIKLGDQYHLPLPEGRNPEEVQFTAQSLSEQTIN